MAIVLKQKCVWMLSQVSFTRDGHRA